MKQKTRWHDALVLAAVLCAAFLIVTGTQQITGRIDGVASMVFVLAVFLISIYTDGYVWGVVASLIGVLAVNFAFRSPYFAFNFTLPENRATLLRAVSHDLRTPLTSIYGACSTVIENYDSLEKEQKLKLLGEACSDAQWLNRMVENLLSVTRFDGGQVAVLDELIDTVLVRFQKRYPKVPVTTYLPDSFIVIPMDSMLISQVLTNLLENAAVHAEGMTQLTLRVFTLGSRAVFEVSDNGCGIPKERLRTLFTGVLPADAAADSGKHGMGIGLSVCAAIVKAHGGEIQAESKVGEGTSIRFWLETESIDTEENEDEQ